MSSDGYATCCSVFSLSKFSEQKVLEHEVRFKPSRMCHASRDDNASGTAVAIKAYAIIPATVDFLFSGSFVMISSMRLATLAYTDCPAPYLVIYLLTYLVIYFVTT